MTGCFFLFSLVLLVTANPQCSQNQLFSRIAWENVKAVIDDAINRNVFAGAVVMATRGDETLEYTAGFQDIENNITMDSNALFRLCSMSKLIAHVALLSLVDKGKILITDPIKLHLPEFSSLVVCVDVDCIEKEPAKTDITIEHLLLHQAGFSHCLGLPPKDAPCRQYKLQSGCDYWNISLEDHVKAYAAAPLQFHPGTSSAYSIAPDIVGRIVEVITQKPLLEALEELIFKPAGMTETSFFIPETSQSRKAKLYCGTPEDRTVVQPRGPLLPIAVTPFKHQDKLNIEKGKLESLSCGLTSTARDYSRFLQSITHLTFFSQNLLTKSLQKRGKLSVSNKYNPLITWDLSYLMDSDLGGLSVLPTISWTGLYGTMAFSIPDKDFTFVLMTQAHRFCDNEGITRVFQFLRHAAFGLTN
eukprot:TRINITY_DN5929_c0_g2_i1.p1 TRINITY_DN5929_c0_g2~~TRINITY_DN5929_c0_g2_i1.p1  ORF type:complete len:416 (-),score=43.42 TRINITY_DN5929_c0_g2_i1:81-1328(-)